MKLAGVRKSFAGFAVLDGFSMDINGSGVTCFFGPSGCGKTTLMNIIAGILSADGGSIVNKPEKISYVFQDGRLLPWLNAADNAACVEKHSKDRAREFLRRLGIEDLSKKPSELSGGMRQRVNVARALNYGFDMMILDEPFHGMDSGLKKIAGSVIMEETGSRPVLFITHDISEALAYSDEIVMLTGPPLAVASRFTVAEPKEMRFCGGALDDSLLCRYSNRF